LTGTQKKYRWNAEAEAKGEQLKIALTKEPKRRIISQRRKVGGNSLVRGD
jgi:hypothetical protein